MASSDNLASLEPWLFRSAFTSDPWFNFSDTDTLTTPLSSAAGASPSDDSLYDVLTSVVNNTATPNPDTPRGSGSGSDPDTKASKRAGPGPASGRVGKRKPRASKKNPTTYITADAANFRQMVQQVTGVKFAAAGLVPPAILKPEPQRIGGSGGGGTQGLLPTLDTSAFLLGPQTSAASTSFELLPEIGCGGGGAAGLAFDGFSCFPTLDSWKAS